MRKDRLLIAMLLEDIDSDISKELIQSVVNSLPVDREISLVTLPGKDIMVFGFDNTFMSSELSPSLASLGSLGAENAVLYLFEQPFDYRCGSFDGFPKSIRIKSVIRNGKVSIFHDRCHSCCLEEIFTCKEIPRKIRSAVTFPIFHKNSVYGFFLCNTNSDVYDIGEFTALQLGRALYISERA